MGDLFKKALNRIEQGPFAERKTFAAHLYSETFWSYKKLAQVSFKKEKLSLKVEEEQETAALEVERQSFDFLKSLANHFENGAWFDLRFNKLSQHSAVNVMFVNSSFVKELERQEGPYSDLTSIFSGSIRTLFEKMIKAMNLQTTDYLISAVSTLPDESSQSYLEVLTDEIVYWKPQFIVPLGAQATRSLLDSSERMTRVHGSFIDKTFRSHGMDFSSTIIPLFHPEFLTINPSMKKTAWLDMQKLMKKLGK